PASGSNTRSRSTCCGSASAGDLRSRRWSAESRISRSEVSCQDSALGFRLLITDSALPEKRADFRTEQQRERGTVDQGADAGEQCQCGWRAEGGPCRKRSQHRRLGKPHYDCKRDAGGGKLAERS